MKITLVRHGQTDANFDENVQGRQNNLLNDTGRRQAKQLAMSIKNNNYDACFSSPLIRAMETSMILVGDRLVIERDDRLLERDMGQLEGMNKCFYDLEKFWDRELNSNDDDIERINDMFDRCEKFLIDIKNKYEKVIIVSHGGTIRVLLNIINGEKFNGKIPNCCKIEVEY